jgi:hypothetical protein
MPTQYEPWEVCGLAFYVIMFVAMGIFGLWLSFQYARAAWEWIHDAWTEHRRWK